jgi:hypothetical protein
MLKGASQDARQASSSAARARAKAGGKRVTVHPDPSQRVLRPKREARREAQFPVDGRQSGGVRRGRPPVCRCLDSSILKVFFRDSSFSHPNCTQYQKTKYQTQYLVCESVGGLLLKFAKICQDCYGRSLGWVLDSVSNGD